MSQTLRGALIHLCHLLQVLLSLSRLPESRFRLGLRSLSRLSSPAVPQFLIRSLLLDLASSSPVFDVLMMAVRGGLIVIVQLQFEVEFLLSDKIVHLGQRIAVVALVLLVVILLFLFQEFCIYISFRAAVAPPWG